MYGIWLILHHHFPHLKDVLSTIDSVCAMRQMQYNTEAVANYHNTGLNIAGHDLDVGGNDEGMGPSNEEGQLKGPADIDEQIHMCLQDLKGLLQDL